MGQVSRFFAAVIAALALLGASVADASTPDHGSVAPDASGHSAPLTWSGSVIPGTAVGGTTDDCFDAANKPDPTSGCDFFKLDVGAPADFYDRFLGGVQIDIAGFTAADLDLGVYVRKPDGTKGDRVTGSGNPPGQPESALISRARGAYWVAVVPYAAAPGQTYTGKAQFVTKAKPDLAALNRKAPPAPPNYRASHDGYISHSEPSIAMDPLNPDHLIAGSKMYENLPEYLFKIGTYESFDGGRSWTDLGHLPGYCQKAGECDPSNQDAYRTTSDISLAYDDEGNAYANLLDAPGGTAAFTGFNITLHVKHGAGAWSGPITIHDNRTNPITQNFLLDDKNWVAVDNHTDVNGGPNRPRDGKIGTMYACWSFDGSQAPSQSIVVMRSVDGGKTWGGVSPGDNTPRQLSEKPLIAGIGCHIVIGPKGEAYITWYDNQLDTLFQVKSTDRGQSWTPAYPIAQITGVNNPFPGQAFRNLSIPTTGIDSKGNLYVAVASQDAQGAPVVSGALELGDRIAHGEFKDPEELRRALAAHEEASGDASSGADIVLFKSTDGGNSWTGPVRVNQDAKTSKADQFQPWMAITPKGQVDVMYFDRRNDPANFYIDTYLSRSDDGGKTFRDTRVTQRMWDPTINPPISTSGEFIGDYQALAANDDVAIPFWNDTQYNQLPRGSSAFSPWQEVTAAVIPNGGIASARGCRDRTGPRSSIDRRSPRIRRGRRGLTATGRSSDVNRCARNHVGRVRHVYVAVAQRVGKRCRWMLPGGRFGRRSSCGRAVYIPARARRARSGRYVTWSFGTRRRLARGRYRLLVRAVDAGANLERRPRSRSFRVR